MAEKTNEKGAEIGEQNEQIPQWELMLDETLYSPLEPSRENMKVCCPECGELVELYEGDYKYFCGECNKCGLGFGISVCEPKIHLNVEQIDTPHKDITPKNCLKCGSSLNNEYKCLNCRWSFKPIKKGFGQALELKEWW